MKPLDIARQNSFTVPQAAARRIGLAAAWLASLVTAQAHPGHGFAEGGMAHAISSPYHLAILAAAGLVLFVAGRLTRRRLGRGVLQIGGAATVAVAGVLWGLG